MAIRRPGGNAHAAKEHLRALATDIYDTSFSKWSSAYVGNLGILEHCDEILTLHREWSATKAKGFAKTADRMEQAILNEIADLWCIIQMRRIRSPRFAERCNIRALKFRAD